MSSTASVDRLDGREMTFWFTPLRTARRRDVAAAERDGNTLQHATHIQAVKVPAYMSL